MFETDVEAGSRPSLQCQQGSCSEFINEERNLERMWLAASRLDFRENRLKFLGENTVSSVL